MFFVMTLYGGLIGEMDFEPYETYEGAYASMAAREPPRDDRQEYAILELMADRQMLTLETFTQSYVEDPDDFDDNPWANLIDP